MRDLHTVQLEEKTLLSASAACYHLRFRLADAEALTWEPGQFLSFLADTAQGKTYTRAYSLASAPAAGSAAGCFDLCVNRVPDGFFSNLLCDLEPGAKLHCHGPHGLFTPKTSAAGGLMVAEGTGIAPFRSFVQWLFPAQGPPRNGGRTFTLLYSAPAAEELFYDREFRELAEREPCFDYVPVIEEPSPPGEHPLREQALVRLAATLLQPAGAAAGEYSPLAGEYAHYAYLCGLAALVKPARAQLLALGLERRQVLFERYD